MFRCVSHNLQGELACYLLENTCLYATITYDTVVGLYNLKDKTLLVYSNISIFWRNSPPVGPDLLIHEVSRSHTTTHLIR